MEDGRGKGKWEGRDRAWDGMGKGKEEGEGKGGQGLQPPPPTLIPGAANWSGRFGGWKIWKFIWVYFDCRQRMIKVKVKR